jgi:N-acetylglucosaminyl-diphospho-decaprenol L-rhamnosyltransferase
MDCTIIIPTFNTRAITLDCIRNLRKAAPRISHEIIVVDNNSTDDTTPALSQEFPELQVMRNSENVGFSKACNRAAKEAKGRYLCFLNSDTVNAGAAIDRLVQWFEEHPKTGIVGPELRSPDNHLIQMSWVWNPILAGELFQQYLAPYSLRRSSFKRNCVAWLQRKSRHVSIICGACLMMRREAYDQIGGFDEDFELYFEDSDLCYRCRQAGWEIDFVADAKITHHLGQSTRGSWSVTSLIYQQSHIAYYHKHTSRWTVWLLKLYLLCKWARLYVVTRREKENREQSIPYCRAYLKMIFERRKYTLAEGIPR